MIGTETTRLPFLIHSGNQKFRINLPLQQPFGRDDIIQLCPDLRNAKIMRSVSRKHARIDILKEKGKIFISDLDSTNGTKIDGLKIPMARPTSIVKSNKIQLGILELTLNN